MDSIRFCHFLGYVFLDTRFGFIFLFGSLFVAGEAKISIFPRVFGVFRLVWGVFSGLSCEVCRAL